MELHSVQKYLELDPTELHDDVLTIIKQNGPLFSKDITLGESKKGTWGSAKQSTLTIDHLFHLGRLGIHSRNGAVKRYDLLHKLIGDVAFESCPFESDEDFILYYLLRRIKSMGLVWNKSSVAFSGLHIQNKKIRTEYLHKLLQLQLIEEVKIDGINEVFYVPNGALDIPYNLKDMISFIAPLDNVIWDRQLIKKLFDFDYKWEVYTPAKKRKYGYYVLPILFKNTFIGRIEFETYRKQGDFQVKQIWWEPHIKLTKKIQYALDRAIKRFEKYIY